MRSTLLNALLRRKREDQPWSMVPSPFTRRKARFGSKLSPRTFWNFADEFSSFRKGRPREDIVKALAVCSDAAMFSLRPDQHSTKAIASRRRSSVVHEAIRHWTLRFGTEYARRLRHTRGTCSNIWHLDELCLMINGERSWLWRAVDDAGEALDILVQRRRSALAAMRFLRKLLKGLRMAPCATDRSAGELRSGESRRDADRLPSPRLAPEQPRREFASTRPPACATAPAATEPFSMPPRDCSRLNQHERLLPARPPPS